MPKTGRKVRLQFSPTTIRSAVQEHCTSAPSALSFRNGRSRKLQFASHDGTTTMGSFCRIRGYFAMSSKLVPERSQGFQAIYRYLRRGMPNGQGAGDRDRHCLHSAASLGEIRFVCLGVPSKLLITGPWCAISLVGLLGEKCKSCIDRC